MKRLLLFIQVFLSLSAYSQTTYYSYDPNTGTSTKVGYSSPTNSSYNSSYVPRYDLNLYKETLERKQMLYDSRVSAIRQRMKDIVDYMDAIRDKDSYTKILAQLNDLADQLSSHHYDYTDDNLYEWVNNNLDIIRHNINNCLKAN